MSLHAARALRSFALLSAFACPAIALLAQDPVKAFPQNYQLDFENDAVKVIRVHYGPHEKVGVHDHSAYPTIYVYLRDSPPVHFVHDEKPPFAQTRPALKAGSFRVSPGRVERHAVENLGDTGSDFLRVELKQVPLGGVSAFRGDAPADLGKDQDTVEYDSPVLKMERMVSHGLNGEYGLPALEAGSLLIWFSASSFKAPVPGRAGTLFPSLESEGAVRWVPPSQSGYILPTAGAPAHLLRIILKNSAATE